MKNRVNGTKEADTVPKHDPNQPPTHFAVPVPVFLAIKKVVGGLSWEQVSPLMNALAECRGFVIPELQEVSKD